MSSKSKNFVIRHHHSCDVLANSECDAHAGKIGCSGKEGGQFILATIACQE